MSSFELEDTFGYHYPFGAAYFFRCSSCGRTGVTTDRDANADLRQRLDAAFAARTVPGELPTFAVACPFCEGGQPLDKADA